MTAFDIDSDIILRARVEEKASKFNNTATPPTV